MCDKMLECPLTFWLIAGAALGRGYMYKEMRKWVAGQLVSTPWEPWRASSPPGIRFNIYRKTNLGGAFQILEPFLVAVLGDDLYEDLWGVCTGTHVPEIGQRVFYFIQGHIEQLQTLMGAVQIPFFNAPSKILCHVMNSQLKQTAHLIPALCIPEPSRLAIRSFCKTLTASDIRGHDGFLIPHNHATECLPPLDMLQTNPSQELVARDLHDHQWKFKHVYKGEPRRHFLTAGWNKFVRAKKLIPGDSFIFLRGEGAELCVGVRHAQVQCMGKKSHISIYYMPRLGSCLYVIEEKEKQSLLNL